MTTTPQSVRRRFVTTVVSALFAAATELGALCSAEHFAKVMGCIQTARDEGGTIELPAQKVKMSKDDLQTRVPPQDILHLAV